MFLSSVKEKWMIFSNFVAFSEYMNFKFCNLQDFFPKFKSRVHKGVFKKNARMIKCKLLLYKEF